MLSSRDLKIGYKVFWAEICVVSSVLWRPVDMSGSLNVLLMLPSRCRHIIWMLVQQRVPPPALPTPLRYSHYSTVEQMAQKPTTLSIIHHAYSAPQFAWAPLLWSSCRESTWLQGCSTAPPEAGGGWGWEDRRCSEVSALLCVKLKYANRLSLGIPRGASQLQRFEQLDEGETRSSLIFKQFDINGEMRKC